MSLQVGKRLKAIVLRPHEKRRCGSVIGIGLLIGNEGRKTSRALTHEAVIKTGTCHEDVDFALTDPLFEFFRRNTVVNEDRIRRKGRSDGFKRDFDCLRRLRRFRERDHADAERTLLENRKRTPGESVERWLVGGTRRPPDKGGSRRGGGTPKVGPVGRRGRPRRPRHEYTRRKKREKNARQTDAGRPPEGGPARCKSSHSRGRRKKCSMRIVRSAHV